MCPLAARDTTASRGHLVPVPGAFDKYKKWVSLMYDLKEEDIRRHACYQVQSRVERAGADTS